MVIGVLLLPHSWQKQSKSCETKIKNYQRLNKLGEVLTIICGKANSAL